MTTAHRVCKRDHALLCTSCCCCTGCCCTCAWARVNETLPPRVRPRPQWCRRTMMMPRGRSGRREDAAFGRGVAIIPKHEPSVTRRRHHRWPVADATVPKLVALHLWRRALSRRAAAFFPNGPILRHDSWAATYMRLELQTTYLLPTYTRLQRRAAPKKILGLLSSGGRSGRRCFAAWSGGGAPAFRCGRSKIILCAGL